MLLYFSYAIKLFFCISNQLIKTKLKTAAIPHLVGTWQSYLNTVGNILNRNIKSLLYRFTKSYSSRENAREDIPRAVDYSVNVPTEREIILPRSYVISRRALQITKAHAREDRHTTAKSRQPFQHRPDVGFVVIVGERHIQEKASLSHIRDNIVGFCAEPPHLHDKFIVEACVKPAVVAEDGVNDNEILVAAEAIEEIRNDLYLRFRG